MHGDAIEIEGLAIGYGGKKAAVTVAGSINATLRRGEVVALVGRNGAGKSTLLRTLAGYRQPLAGSLRYAGLQCGEATPASLSKLLSVVLTDTAVALNLTVRELVAIGRTPYTNFIGHLRACDKEIVERAMAAIGILPLADRRVGTLSDGERQKCMIAKALAQETPIVMLDEPTAFLDFPSKVALFRLLKKLAVEMNKAVLVSSHDVELVLRLCDRLWLLDDGTLHCGTAAELSANGALHSFIDGDGIRYDAQNHSVVIS